eukprot:1193771-Prorocentrum_minimum.AAC.2
MEAATQVPTSPSAITPRKNFAEGGATPPSGAAFPPASAPPAPPPAEEIAFRAAMRAASGAPATSWGYRGPGGGQEGVRRGSGGGQEGV